MVLGKLLVVVVSLAWCTKKEKILQTTWYTAQLVCVWGGEMLGGVSKSLVFYMMCSVGDDGFVECEVDL